MHRSQAGAQVIEIIVEPHGGTAGAVRVAGDQRPAMTVYLGGAGYLCPFGHPDPFLLCATSGGVCRARGSSRAYSVERGQASSDLRHDGVLSGLGATVELVGNGASVPDQLGSGVPVGGMVCAVGLGAS